jgi:hypothetical protein
MLLIYAIKGASIAYDTNYIGNAILDYTTLNVIENMNSLLTNRNDNA